MFTYLFTLRILHNIYCCKSTSIEGYFIYLDPKRSIFLYFISHVNARIHFILPWHSFTLTLLEIKKLKLLAFKQHQKCI